MAIAKKLDDIHPFFMQDCPLCGRANRIVLKGVYVKDNKIEKYPDIGYSFCNCKAIFYTRKENVTEPFEYAEKDGVISAPDPFFCEWGSNPYTFIYWNPRKYEILWDMESFCEHVGGIECWRDFDVDSKTPQHFHIKVRQ